MKLTSVERDGRSQLISSVGQTLRLNVITARPLALARYLLTLVAVSFGAAAPVSAVCPQPQPKACAEFFKSTAVVLATVESEASVPAQGDFYDAWRYHLRVHRVFRGSPGKSLTVFTENASARLRLAVGEQYLLFASAAEDRLWIDSCGNSALASASDDRVRVVEDLRNGRTSIEGHVAARPAWVGVAGVRLIITGGARAFRAVTDAAGAFAVPVPPGKYSVKAESAGVVPFDLSYDDPRQVVVQRGQCGQVQFVAEAR